MVYCIGGGRRALAQGRDNFSFLECLFQRYSRPYMMELEEVTWANTRPAKRCSAAFIGLSGQKMFRNGVCAAKSAQKPNHLHLQLMHLSIPVRLDIQWRGLHLTYSGYFNKPVEEIGIHVYW